jgi:hypothetical protein
VPDLSRRPSSGFRGYARLPGYGDGSFTFGDFSTETLAFRRILVALVAVDCGHDNEGLFVGAVGGFCQSRIRKLCTT